MSTYSDTHFGYEEDDYRTFRRYAWRYLFFFSVLYCCLYCTRLNLPNASAVIIDELGWSKADIGILTATLFWTYALGQFINGRLSEVFDPKGFIFLAVLLSVVANCVITWQTSLVAMALIWAVNGYAQSMAWAPGVAILTRWWPGNRRGFATGFIHGFSGFGTLAATLSVTAACFFFPSYGWKICFLFPALFPFAALLIFALTVKYRPSDVGLKDYVETSETKAKQEAANREILRTKGFFYPYKVLLSNQKFLVWLFIAFTLGIVRYGLVTWIPLYFINEFKIAVTTGLMQTIALPLGMGLGAIFVPWLTDRYCPDNRLWAAVICSFLAFLCVIAMTMIEPSSLVGIFLLQALLFLGGFFVYAVNGTAWAFGTDIGGRLFSATSVGVLDFSEYLGAAVQSIAFGVLIDLIGWNVVFYTVATLCATICLISVTVMLKTTGEAK